MEKKTDKSIFDNRRVTLVAAVLLGVFFWILIAGFIEPSDSRDLPSVLIDYSYDDSKLVERNLQVVGGYEDIYADVRVKGDGVQLGPLTQSAVRVYADYSGITTPGLHEVPLRWQKISTATFTIDGLSLRRGRYSLDGTRMDRVTLNFEEVESKRFEIVPVANEVTPAYGYVQDSITSDPRTVDIRGPKSRIEQIARVEARITEQNSEREESARYSAVPLVLLDEYGNELDPEELALTLSVGQVDVTLSILQIRTIGLKAEFTGMPTYLDTEWFYSRIYMSVQEMQVAGSAEAFERLDNPMTVAWFDVSELGLNWESAPQNIDLSDYGVRNYDQLRYVTVSFDTTGLVEKTFVVPTDRIRVVNAGRNTSVLPVAETVTVKLIGPEEQINELTPDNIVLQLDAYGITASGGEQQALAARVLVPSANRSFALGNYAIICDVQVGG